MVQNKALIYAAHPTSFPEAGKHVQVSSEEFNLEQAPPAGGMIVKLHYASIDPYQRTLMKEDKPAHPGKEFMPGYQIGKPLANHSIVSVVKSDVPKYEEGRVLYSPWSPTQEYTVVEKGSLDAYQPFEDNPHSLDPSLFLGALGMPGLTAFSSFYEIGKPKKGETFFVSAASGAVGQLAGQLARHEGLKVIGSVGDDEKLDFIINKLGFDGGFNYKKEKPMVALERLAPEGIDIYFENVGGETLEAAIHHLNKFGRVICCGSISQYNLPEDQQYGVRGLRNMSMKRIILRGFIVGDPEFGPVYHKDHQAKVQKWIADGTFKAEQSVSKGIENGPQALVGIFQGKNFGKAVLEVSPL